MATTPWDRGTFVARPKMEGVEGARELIRQQQLYGSGSRMKFSPLYHESLSQRHGPGYQKSKPEQKRDMSKEGWERQRLEPLDKWSQPMFVAMPVNPTSQSVSVLCDSEIWLRLGKELNFPENVLKSIWDRFPDPALRGVCVYQWHFVNWICTALSAIREQELAQQLAHPIPMPVDHIRVDRRLLYRRLGRIEDKWRALGQVLCISKVKLERMETGEKPCLLAVLHEYDEDRRFVEALCRIGKKDLADKLDADKGVALQEVISLTLKYDKWITVRRMLKLQQPEEEMLLELMSLQGAEGMVAALLSEHMARDDKAVSELLETLVPRQQEKTPGGEVTKYNPYMKMEHESFMAGGDGGFMFDPGMFMDIQVSVQHKLYRSHSAPSYMHLLPPSSESKEPSAAKGASDHRKQPTSQQPSQDKAASAPSQFPSKGTEVQHSAPASTQPIPSKETPSSMGTSEDEKPVPLAQPVPRDTDSSSSVVSPPLPKVLDERDGQASTTEVHKAIEPGRKGVNKALLRQMLCGSEGESSDEDCSDDSSDDDGDSAVSGAPTGDRGQQRTPDTSEPRKLSEIGYQEYLQEFDEVFESAHGFSVQSNIADAVLRVWGDSVQGIDLGTKAAKVPNPDGSGERYELRPCLKIIVHDLEQVDRTTRQEIAIAVVNAIEARHGRMKRFVSDDYEEWLDFITLSSESADRLCDNEAAGDATPDISTKMKPGAQFMVKSSQGTWGCFAQNTVEVLGVSKSFHHGLTCAHCVLPADVCWEVVEDQRNTSLDPCQTGGPYYQWLEADVIPEGEQSSVKSQLQNLPLIGINTPCECTQSPCTCPAVAHNNERYDHLHRWLTIVSLYPGMTAATNAPYSPQGGVFAGAVKGFFPAVDGPEVPPSGCTVPVRNLTHQGPLDPSHLVTASCVNIDFGGVSIDNVPKEHTVAFASPSNISKWKTAQKFGRSLMPPSPLCVKPTDVHDLPVYALSDRAPQEGRMCNQGGELCTAQVIRIPETNDREPFFKPGDSGCVVYTLHHTSGTGNEVTGVVFGMLYSGGTLRANGKGQYYVFPLVRALKYLQPQLNYKDAQLLLEDLPPPEATEALKRYAKRFIKAEKLKRNIIAKTYNTTLGDPLKILHEIYLVQCNDPTAVYHTRNLSFQLDPCVSKCGTPSYCTNEKANGTLLEVPPQAKPATPHDEGDHELKIRLCQEESHHEAEPQVKI